MRTPLHACLLTLAVAATLLPLPTEAAGNAVRGRATAIQDCSACHQVTAAQGQPEPTLNPDSGEQIAPPSFFAIGAKYAGNTKALRDFIHAPQYPMKEQDFRPQDLDDIVAYILSLKKKP